MSFNFSTVGTNGPTPTAPAAKDIQVKAVKLTSADFSTGGTASVKAYLPADASIIGFRMNVKTTFSGNGVTALNVSIGILGNPAKFVNHPPTLTAGTYSSQIGLTNSFQEYDPTAPGGDIPLLFTGTATTGNPTAGELYVLIEFVR